MTVSLLHTTPADGTFSAQGATAWDAEHALTMAGGGTILGRTTAGTGAVQELTEITLTSGTKTASAPVMNMTQTWNNAAVTFTGYKFNVTDTASNAASLLMDLQVGGTSMFRVDKTGRGRFAIDLWLQSDASDRGLFFGSDGGTVIRRRATRNISLGLDAAAPGAYTLSVGNVTAGTSNTAGANFTITGSQGTGTGAGGSIIFQVAPAGSSGTAQNALATALTIAGDRTATFTSTVNVSNLQMSGNVLYFNGFNSASRCNNSAYVTRASGLFAFDSSDATVGTSDVILTRRAAANLRLGAADAAAPVAQTLSVQSVVAGTSNTAGQNWTLTGSVGTGTGAGGDVIVQVAPAGTSGTAQNSLQEAFRVHNTRTVTAGAAFTVATLPAAGTQGRRAWVTDATAPTFLGTLTGGGAVVCPVFDNGTNWVAA